MESKLKIENTIIKSKTPFKKAKGKYIIKLITEMRCEHCGKSMIASEVIESMHPASRDMKFCSIACCQTYKHEHGVEGAMTREIYELTVRTCFPWKLKKR